MFSGIYNILTGNWNYWVYTALSFLVMSCPCALVLSVPLAFFSGIGKGSKMGILFKGGVSIEAMTKVKAVVMDKTGEPALRQALKVQRKEYSDLEAEGKLLAQRKGISIEQIGAVTKRMSAWLSRGQLLVGEPNSKIAGMMIQGNTRGMIKGLKNLHHCVKLDASVNDLAQTLLRREEENIRQACRYL